MQTINSNNENLSHNYLRQGTRIVFSVLGLIILFLIIAAGYQGVKLLSNLSGSTRTIQISGTGEVEAKPDISEITFTLREVNNTTDKSKNVEIQNKISSQMDSLIKDFKNLKIEDKDIKTTNYNVNPKYTYQDCSRSVVNYIKPCESNLLTGYEASQSVTVKVRDTSITGKVLSILSAANITEVNGPNFSIDDPEKLKAEARDIAIKDAKEKAESLSRSLGVNIEKIISFSDNTNDYTPYPVMYKNSTMSVGVQSVPAMDANIQEGSQKINSNVTITFEIED
jgi:hypothetical protein